MKIVISRHRQEMSAYYASNVRSPTDYEWTTDRSRATILDDHEAAAIVLLEQFNTELMDSWLAWAEDP